MFPGTTTGVPRKEQPVRKAGPATHAVPILFVFAVSSALLQRCRQHFRRLLGGLAPSRGGAYARPVNDCEWMREALALARKGIGLTSPNPPVGAVLVKDGREIGRGWHRGAGRPHAEVEAIQDAVCRHGPEAPAGATIYVTLEPCSTRGRSGACTTAIMQAGIRRVVFGAIDPHPAHAGRATGLLQAAGVKVLEGVEESACEVLIRPFAKAQRCGLPWIILKTAMSLDGRITRPAGEGPWLSSAASRRDVQKLRLEADAILTSGQTVRNDDPRLTLRSLDVPDTKKQPWRIVLTSREDGVPPDARLRRDAWADRTRIFHGRRIEQVLRELVAACEVSTVLVEAGGRLLGRLLDEEWADEMVVYLAPLVTGGEVPAVAGEGAASLAERWRLDEVRFARIGADVRLRGRFAGRGGPLER